MPRSLHSRLDAAERAHTAPRADTFALARDAARALTPDALREAYADLTAGAGAGAGADAGPLASLSTSELLSAYRRAILAS